MAWTGPEMFPAVTMDHTMKSVVALAALAAMIALPAHAQRPQLIADWQAFAGAEPNRPNLDAIHADLDACRDQACVTDNRLSSDDVQKLAWWVSRGNRLAIRLSFDAANLIDTSSDGGQQLAQSYGGLIKADPTAFLAMAHDEGASTATVTTDAVATSDLISENYTAQARELKARLIALREVDDTALNGMRDQCMTAIAVRLKAIAPKIGGFDDDGAYHPKKEAL